LTRTAPADTRVNAVAGTVRELSYFGSFTVYHVALASGATLKVSQANVDRHPEARLSWGDAVWAHWDGWSQVVLTQ
ncbi:MAG TPA: TOBE domain-containing protein, partial [Aquabacterium sp.]|nr:TOBE domain-containing protein [Aquabacterium sp.]